MPALENVPVAMTWPEAAMPKEIDSMRFGIPKMRLRVIADCRNSSFTQRFGPR